MYSLFLAAAREASEGTANHKRTVSSEGHFAYSR